ncbi:MAG: efflux RND transporter periplasmic adaptor subunit [Saprospiraceae bacterium]|nr:efflux RND transporter periplasmic adaptor subunit [Saprospiraceae bacterium]
MKKSTNNFSLIGRSILILGIGFIIGWLVRPVEESESKIPEVSHMHTDHESTTWTCSMHPQIRQGEPGKCPICGMDLIPLDQEIEENPRVIRMSSTAMALANIQTEEVNYGTSTKEISLNGKIQPDERLMYSQVSHIGGRVESLSINFTGERIQKGQKIAEIYSPELVTAQEELFIAEKLKDIQPGLFNAAKEKLKNWKLNDQQIEEIIASGKTTERFPILADVSGIVLEKKVNLGDYISRGTPLYEIVDLTKVWVLFDIYENDMSWVKVGNRVTFTVASLPGESFRGRISFIDPIIDPVTRVATARLEISNSAAKLKPEMFVSGILSATTGNKNTKNLLIPKSAVMWTGPRSIVYEKREDDRGIVFEMKEIELGPLVGDNYILKEGLEAGTEIATHGTFSIDAAAQLSGKPSMMSPLGNMVKKDNHLHVAMDSLPSISLNTDAQEALKKLFDKYFVLKNALVSDNFSTVQTVAKELLDDLQNIKMDLFQDDAHHHFMNHSQPAIQALQEIQKAKDIGQSRQAFYPLSIQFIAIAKIFDPFSETIYVQHCPMANHNTGADWLSENEQIENPYFGSQMLKCGSVTEEIK